MIPLPEPDEFDTDVMAVDAALDALARRRPVVADSALSALAAFAQAVDARAAALEPGGRSPYPVQLNGKPASHDGQPLRWAAPAATVPSPVGRHERTQRAGRKRWRRALLAVPVAAVAIVLTGMLPLNDSPGSPLYPLHQLIFHPDDRAADDIRLRLASASQALDDAVSNSGPTREAGFDQARRDLAEARKQLAQVADSGTRAELERQLSNLEHRATELADDGDDDQGGPPDQGSQGQDEGNADGNGATPGPMDDSQGDQGQPHGNEQNQGP